MAAITEGCGPGSVDPAAVADWVAKHVSITQGSRPGFASHLIVQAVLPLSAAQAYELITHPDNAAIFRGIDACSYRHILSNDDCGRLIVEVENVSVWRLLFFSGRIATKLLVRQDYHAGTMHVELPPGQDGPRTPGCKQVPLEKLQARWSIKPLSECLDAAAPILPPIPPEATDRLDEGYSFVRLEQSLQPWGIPGFLNGAFKGFARGQAQQTFEDVLAEAHRIRAGFPSLCPYEEVCMKEIRPEDLEKAQQAAEADAAPTPAAAAAAAAGGAAPEPEASSTAGASSGKAAAAAAAAGAAAGGGARGPKRRPSLRGFRLTDWEVWESEREDAMELDVVSESGRSGMEESAEGSCTPMEEAAGSDCGSDSVWQLQHHLAVAAARFS